MKRKEKCSEVPISAMIDVVFLLLVYFIVTSTDPVDEAFVSVNLPGPGPETKTLSQLDVYVLEERYVVSGRKLNLNEAGEYFKSVAAADDSIHVNVKVHVDSSHSHLVLLLDKLNEAKLANFNLHTLK